MEGMSQTDEHGLDSATIIISDMPDPEGSVWPSITACHCVIPGCTRQPWNGVAGEACCRTCITNEGRFHGDVCNARFHFTLTNKEGLDVGIPNELVGAYPPSENCFLDVPFPENTLQPAGEGKDGHKPLAQDTSSVSSSKHAAQPAPSEGSSKPSKSSSKKSKDSSAEYDNDSGAVSGTCNTLSDHDDGFTFCREYLQRVYSYALLHRLKMLALLECVLVVLAFLLGPLACLAMGLTGSLILPACDVPGLFKRPLVVTICLTFIIACVTARCVTCTQSDHKALWKYDRDEVARLAWLQSYTCLATSFIIGGVFVRSLMNLRYHGLTPHLDSSMKCILMIWCTHIVLTMRKVKGICVASNYGDYFHTFAQGFSLAALLVCAAWTYGMVMMRISILDAAMARTESSLVPKIRRCVRLGILGAICALLCLSGGFAGAPVIVVKIAFMIAAGGGASFWCAAGIITVQSFFEPIRRVKKEMDRMTGYHREQCRFARDSLRKEACAAGTATLSTFIVGVSYIFSAFSLIDKTNNTSSTSNAGSEDLEMDYLIETVFHNVDSILNTFGMAILSGALTSGIRRDSICEEVEPQAHVEKASSVLTHGENETDEAWNAKVIDMSQRSVTAGKLLEFYKNLFDSMPSWKPKASTTNDVVRQAIIPQSKISQAGGTYGGQAWACLHDEPGIARRMITHSWNAYFKDLVASVVADALQESTYGSISKLLTNRRGVAELEQRLIAIPGAQDMRYWICIFCVNQHSCICGSFGREPQDPRAFEQWDRKRRDTVTGKIFQVCDCAEPKHFNDSPVCEMDKFDIMMQHLHVQNPGFIHVSFCDHAFDIFNRVWCVAELVIARESRMMAKVIMPSLADMEQKYRMLAALDVRKCISTRPEDKEQILNKIAHKDAFNNNLQRLIFGRFGLLANVVEAEARNSGVGRIVARALRPDPLLEE